MQYQSRDLEESAVRNSLQRMDHAFVWSLVVCASQVVLIIAIPLIFKFITPKTSAALVASLLFLVMSTSSVLVSYRFRWWINVFTSSIFLLLFVLPIFWTRWTHVGEEFVNLTIFGLSAQVWHSLSNYGFGIWFMSHIYTCIQLKISSQRESA